MLPQLKQTLLKSARLTHGDALVARSAWRRHRLLILCYHGVSISDEHRWNPELYVTPERLAARLASLRALDATIVSLDDAVERLGRGTLPPRAVAITFDDGAADFTLRALPVLRAYEAPATVYLTTYYVQHAGLPVWNVAAAYLLWTARAQRDASLAAVVGGDAAFDLSTAGGRMLALSAFRARWADEDTRAKDAAVDALAAALHLDPAQFRAHRQLQLMTPAEVSALPTDLIQVELHTHRHRTPMDQALFRRELVDNAAVIRELTGRTPRHFCYPSGYARREFLPWLREAGVRSATTCAPGLASPRLDPLMLPRLIDTSLTPDETFAGWVTGVAACLPSRTHTLADVAEHGTPPAAADRITVPRRMPPPDPGAPASTQSPGREYR